VGKGRNIMTSKEAAVKPQSLDAPKKGINWETVKTVVITAFVFGSLGLIGGYFVSINIHSDARASVVQDMKIVSKTVEQ
jgi:hypothetical protein